VTGADVIASLPPHAGPARELAILEAVRAGLHDPWSWYTIALAHRGRDVVIRVMPDALRLGGVRVNVSHTNAQRLADLLGAWLPTSRISDLVHEHADVVLRPQLGVPDSQMADTSRMIQHSANVAAVLRGRIDAGGCASTVGKDWINTNRLENRPDRAANYGWHDPHAPNGRVWQTVGLAHDRNHVDYSQVLRLVDRIAYVDGAPIDIAELASHPELHGAVSDEGPLRVLRHPGVGSTSIAPPAPA
jgi:hypothetical protein